jgi:hypothetical protein
MEALNDTEIEEFIKLFESMQESRAVPNSEGNSARVTPLSRAITGEVADFARKLFDSSPRSQVENDPWPTRIEKRINDIEDTMVCLAAMFAFLVIGSLVVIMVILRYIGG